MKTRTSITLGLLAVVGCGPPSPDVSADASVAVDAAESAETVEAVEPAIRQFYMDVNAFDHAALRETTASDFEFMNGGRRMDGDAFESFLRGVESGGTSLDFELSELNTEVEGDVAYTSYVAATPRFELLEASVLRRSGGRWLVDRTISAGAVPR